MVVLAHSSDELVKENASLRAPLAPGWLLAALAALLAALAAVARIDHALPEPLGRDAPPDRFHGLAAHELLVNLTSIGPRVAGSYENEVLAVSMLVSAIKHIAQHSSPHNRVELDVHAGSGAFALSFMDGMSNVYRGVQSVVARVRGAGGRPRDRSALLLNCHFDTVPDSPGASDDGAGCAVLLESLRALAAEPRPLRHDAVFLFNGAEENILQASHAFVTQHRWARDVRAFINIEACGAGGREVLFQAGPHDPWIIEFGAHKLAPAHAALLAGLPPWVAATGWGVDLHLYRV
uniref:FXNA-like protease n=1 Tax=Heliothis virescens TaxID=7102 RepID=A0A2A4JGX3_HELVI